MPSDNTYLFRGKVWVYRSWHMVSLPEDVSVGLKKLYRGLTAGFGSLPVEATIGDTTWQTSIFPEDRTGPFMLPLKLLVRKQERFGEGDTITFQVHIIA